MFRKFLPLLLLVYWVTTPEAQDPADSKLQRSGIVVIVKLTDAKDQPLVLGSWYEGPLYLKRERGSFVSSAYAWYDWPQSRVVCGGIGDRGLEPGNYVLAGSPGPYGPFQIRFTVGRSDAQGHTYKFECWRRILTFSLVDGAGKPLNQTERTPWYRYQREDPPSTGSKYIPPVLRDPPGSRGFAWSRARGGGYTPPRNRHATDAGKWYLAVIAGRPGTVILGDHKWEESFDEATWDSPVEIELSVAEDLAKLPLVNADDPGCRSLCGIEPTNRTRVTFELGHELMRPELSVPTIWQTSGNTWTTTVASGAQYRIRGGPLLTTPWSVLPKPQADGSARVTYQGRHGEVVISMPTATLRNWWDWGYAGKTGFDVSFTAFAAVGDSRELRSLVGDTELAELLAAGEVRIEAGGGFAQELSGEITADEPEWRVHRVGDDGRTFGTTLKLDATKKALLKGKQLLKLEAEFTGVCFRGANSDSNAVPEVCATIFPLADEKVALRLKKAESDLAAKDQRPNIESLHKRLAEKLLNADKDTTDDELREWLGGAVYDALPDRECRLRFGRFGAWYDSRCVLNSDEHGYVVNDDLDLTKGVKYVMYVWGGSRDDLKPDARVEFTYTGKDDDLGAIVLPDYE